MVRSEVPFRIRPVSYTHLDVYKRQSQVFAGRGSDEDGLGRVFNEHGGNGAEFVQGMHHGLAVYEDRYKCSPIFSPHLFNLRLW